MRHLKEAADHALAGVIVILVAIAFIITSFAFGQSTGGGHQDLIRYTVTGIDAKTVANTAILTTPAGAGNFHVALVIVEMTAANSLTVGATISVGTNSATFNNIIPATVGQIVLNAYAALMPVAGTVSVPPGTLVNARVSVGATGTSGTVSVTVIGYYS